MMTHLHKQHIEHIFLYVATAIIGLGSLLIGYWLLWPVTVIEFTSPTVTEFREYRRGDSITYIITYCKSRSTVGTVYRSLVNGTITTFTPIMNDLPSGCRVTKKSDLVIPNSADIGTYHLEATIQYKVNPIRTFTANWKSNNFEVIK